MYQIDFEHPIHIHFIGIGGISMSGLAEILLEEGFAISGSDTRESPLTVQLEDHGAEIFYGQKSSNIIEGINLVVYTAAIHENNEEYYTAKQKGIPMLSRAELLGQMMQNYRIPIAVSGTHGKTTTTSMLAHILIAGDTDPTISVGGILKAIGGNIRVGGPDYFLMEACEYTNSFLHFFPKIAVILNIDEDHLDFFKDLADIRHSFHRFAQLIPDDGALIINGDIPYYKEITQGLSCQIVTFGRNSSYDYSAENIQFDQQGHVTFDLLSGTQKTDHIQLSVPGDHNVDNALAAIAVARLIGLTPETIRQGLTSFEGTTRRFEYKGTINDITIMDDYAHHPTEIEATLKAASHYPHREIWCVFQPHTYTRTKALFPEFIEALSHADHVVMVDIFAARETDTLGVSSEKMADALKEKGCDAYYLPSFEEIEEFLLNHCQKNDLLITMGAGNVVTIGEEILQK